MDDVTREPVALEVQHRFTAAAAIAVLERWHRTPAMTSNAHRQLTKEEGRLKGTARLAPRFAERNDDQ